MTVNLTQPRLLLTTLLLPLIPLVGWARSPAWPIAPPQAPTAAGAVPAQSPQSQPSNVESPAAKKVQNQQHNQQTQKQEPQVPQKQQTKRMLWIVPNFGAVSANVKFTPLAPRDKFSLAFHDSFDYSSFTWTAVEAAQGLGLNSDPEFGHGIAGYGRYYWHNYVDGVSGTYFTEAIFPVLTRQDPRYFTLGYGGIFRRTVYALTRTLVTRKDNGRWGFNWSEVGGNAAEATLSNAYYPRGDRGFGQTFQNWGVQMESAALNNVAKEFWPDIRHALFHRK
jgi:hypothetical protein